MTEAASNSNSLNVEKVQFANNRTAHFLKQVPPGTSGQQIVKELKQQGLEQPAGLILVTGGAKQIENLGEHQRSRLTELMSRGVAQAAQSK
jgi:hypothetical protein